MLISYLRSKIESIVELYYQNHGNDHPLFTENAFADFLLICASTLLFFITTLFVLSSLSFFVGGSINPLTPWFALFLTLNFHYFFTRHIYLAEEYFTISDKDSKSALFVVSAGVISLVLLAVIFYNSVNFVNNYYDISYDGQAYHQEMILFLKNGWNPLFHYLKPSDSQYARWLNIYPKAAEIVQTNLYIMTGHIESGKALVLLMAAVAFFLSFSFFIKTKGIGIAYGLLFSLLIVLNPVAIYQSANFYNDGVLYFAFVCLIFSLAFMYTNRRNYPLYLIALSVIFLSNIKTTGLVYAVLILGLFHVFVWYSSKIRLSQKLFNTSVLSVIASVVIFGYSPYVLNTIHYSNPFYPAVGKHHYDYAKYNSPKSFQHIPGIAKLFVSVFSETSNPKFTRGDYTLKMPFTYTEDELKAMTSSGNTLGGFGVLFSGIMALTLSVVTIGALVKGKNHFYSIALLILIIVLSTLINPAAFYARYVPQFWLLPVVVGISALLSRRLLFKVSGVVICALLLANSLIIGREYYTFHTKMSQKMREELSVLSLVSDQKKLAVNFDVFDSNKVRFQEAGIRFIEVKQLNCQAKRVLAKEIQDAKIRICML